LLNVRLRANTPQAPTLSSGGQAGEFSTPPTSDALPTSFSWEPPSFLVGKIFQQLNPEADAEALFEDWNRYMASDELDLPALARSAPEISSLAGIRPSGFPVRLRLFIDESGVVRSVKVLQASSLDAALIEAATEMFRHTGFTPGRLRGQEVASFKDVELSIDVLE
jgi:hypothetical protein